MTNLLGTHSRRKFYLFFIRRIRRHGLGNTPRLFLLKDDCDIIIVKKRTQSRRQMTLTYMISDLHNVVFNFFCVSACIYLIRHPH